MIIEKLKFLPSFRCNLKKKQFKSSGGGEKNVWGGETQKKFYASREFFKIPLKMSRPPPSTTPK